MPRIRRRSSQRADRHDNPQPGVGAVGGALAPHLVHLLPVVGMGPLRCAACLGGETEVRVTAPSKGSG
jgi:hypothetical protein